MKSLDSNILEMYRLSLLSEQGLSKNTINSYINDIVLFFEDYISKQSSPYLGGIMGSSKQSAKFVENDRDNLYSDILKKCESVTTTDIINYIAELKENDQADSTRSRKRSALLSFYTFLEENGFNIKIDFEKVPSVKMNYHFPDALSIEETIQLLDNIPCETPQDIRNRTILEMLYSTGMRISELLDLTLHNIYFQEKVIMVTGKGSKQRYIPLSDYMLDYINLYLKSSRPFFEKRKSSNILFLNKTGGKFSRMGLWKMIHSIILSQGISKTITPHTFRHCFASHLLQNGVNLRIIQELLGHSSISTTQIYIKTDYEFIRENHKLHPRNG